jgi:hypothetical protein
LGLTGRFEYFFLVNIVLFCYCEENIENFSETLMGSPNGY